mgnify:CR=1 FL=1
MNERYKILFESVEIGPVTAKNRFYQVPHCNGGGYRDPSAAAEMRGIKSQGGWGVIFTEQCEMHHTSEITPSSIWECVESSKEEGLEKTASENKAPHICFSDPYFA